MRSQVRDCKSKSAPSTFWFILHGQGAHILWDYTQFPIFEEAQIRLSDYKNMDGCLVYAQTRLLKLGVKNHKST